MKLMDGPTHALELLEPASPEILLPSSGWGPWLAAAALLVVLAGIGWWWWRRRKPPADVPGARRQAAFAEACAALAMIPTTEVREAAVLASLILRRYLSVAAGDPALYETHEEFVARHDALLALAPEVRAATVVGFDRLAALKYAPVIAAAAAVEVIADARALLETLHHGFAP